MSPEYYSSKQEHCVDYDKVHEKVTYKTAGKAFKTVGDLTLPLQVILGSHIPLSATDELCTNFYTHYKEKISRFQTEVGDFDEGNLHVGTVGDSKTYVPENEVIQTMTKSISVMEADASPIKQPTMVLREKRENHAKLKKQKWTEPLQLQHHENLISF
jgi:DNA mismatch repair ATPase MutL